jgi:hypothetical protein
VSGPAFVLVCRVHLEIRQHILVNLVVNITGGLIFDLDDDRDVLLGNGGPDDGVDSIHRSYASVVLGIPKVDIACAPGLEFEAYQSQVAVGLENLSRGAVAYIRECPLNKGIVVDQYIIFVGLGRHEDV